MSKRKNILDGLSLLQEQIIMVMHHHCARTRQSVALALPTVFFSDADHQRAWFDLHERGLIARSGVVGKGNHFTLTDAGWRARTALVARLRRANKAAEGGGG